MFLIVAGLGEALASIFDITHPIGHGIAGLLGVIGFPIAALLLSGALGRSEAWRAIRRPLVWIANLSWISVVALMATLAIMTMQMARANGEHLPQHAPKSLPPGVFAVDGWADLCSAETCDGSRDALFQPVFVMQTAQDVLRSDFAVTWQSVPLHF